VIAHFAAEQFPLFPAASSLLSYSVLEVDSYNIIKLGKTYFMP
jgi:hypothetical protein